MTPEYNELSKRITEIGVNFQAMLDPDPSNHYDNKSQDIIRAYVLLCHAEFEKYFEDITRNTLANIYNTTQKSRYVKKYKSAFSKQFDLFNDIIKRNNGIKLDNIKKILSLCGFDTSNLTNFYIQKLNTLGEKRGNLAHNGGGSLTTLLSFSQEKTEIEWLTKETLTNIDNYF